MSLPVQAQSAFTTLLKAVLNDSKTWGDLCKKPDGEHADVVFGCISKHIGGVFKFSWCATLLQ
eukprot:3958162-Pyramimonas_sp.AAC.1